MSRRTEFLYAMGIGPLWRLRDRPAATPLPEAAPEVEESPPLAVMAEALPPFEGFAAFDDVPPLDEIPPHFFDDGGADEALAPTRPDVSRMDWPKLEDTIRACTACGLCQGRTQAVPGVGDREADWLFVGEGPGAAEDRQGEPFVGPSGKLLDNMLLAIGLKRGENAYIANVVKCRPTDSAGKDRPPTPQEAAACRAYLDRQIALIRPKIIIAVGRIAATALLNADPQTPLAVLRGKAHLYRAPDGIEIPLVATYHPAYLLRQLTEKRKAWEDLCLAMSALTQDN